MASNLFFQIAGGLTHWLIYVGEVIFGYYLWSLSVCVDMSFTLYTLWYIGELKVLTVRFRALKADENYRENLKKIV